MRWQTIRHYGIVVKQGCSEPKQLLDRFAARRGPGTRAFASLARDIAVWAAIIVALVLAAVVWSVMQ